MSLNVLTQGGGAGKAASIFVTGLSENDTVTATKDGKTVNGKWVKKPNPASAGLPSGYTQLEYIESTGTQYIDTGVTGGTNASFEMTARMVSERTNNQFFGTISNFCSVNCSKSGTTYGFRVQGDGSDYPSVYFSENTTSKWTLKVESNGDVYADGVLKGNLSAIAGRGWGGDTYANQIFVTADDGDPYSTSAELYSLKMFTDGVAVRDFIPCINPSGEVGLYDLVNGVFYPNLGSGTFLTGTEIPSTIDGHTITIKDYGLWTVTATNGEQTATQDVLVDVAMEYEIEIDLPVNYLMLYDYGDECMDVTGGWVASKTATSGVTANATNTGTQLYIEVNPYNNGANAFGNIAMIESIDVADYLKLCVNYTQATIKLSTTSNANKPFHVHHNTLSDREDTTTQLAYYQSSFDPEMKLYDIDQLSVLKVHFAYNCWQSIGSSAYVGINGVFVVKKDNWETLATKAGITANSMDDVLTNATTLLSNESAVKYMVSFCTGDFMASFVANADCLDALNNSPYADLVFENKHWKKFLAMVGVTA